MLHTAPLLLPEIRAAIQERNWKGLRLLLETLWPQDIHEILEQLTPAEGVLLFRLLPKDVAAHVFSELEPDLAERLLRSVTDEEARVLLEEMDPDDRTALLDELPASVVRKLLALLPPEERQEALRLLAYPEDSCGRLMSPEFVEAHEHERVGTVLNRVIQKAQELPEEVLHEVYVIDRTRHLLGSVTLIQLLRAPKDQPIGAIVDRQPVHVSAWDDQELAARVMRRYDRLALPVVDREGRLVGVITVDDVLDVLEEETAEDFYKFAAVADPEDRYFSLNIRERIQKRLPWLAGLALLANFSSMILHRYEGLLQQVLVLAVFIPILNGTAGNTGSQCASFVIRALATGELSPSFNLRLVRVYLREITGVLVGLALPLSLIVMGSAWVQTHDPRIMLVTALTMTTAVTVSNTIGFLLPLLAKRVGLDPASISAPFNATLNDALTLLLYFNIARFVLPGPA